MDSHTNQENGEDFFDMKKFVERVKEKCLDPNRPVVVELWPPCYQQTELFCDIVTELFSRTTGRCVILITSGSKSGTKQSMNRILEKPPSNQLGWIGSGWGYERRINGFDCSNTYSIRGNSSPTYMMFNLSYLREHHVKEIFESCGDEIIMSTKKIIVFARPDDDFAEENAKFISDELERRLEAYRIDREETKRETDKNIEYINDFFNKTNIVEKLRKPNNME